MPRENPPGPVDIGPGGRTGGGGGIRVLTPPFGLWGNRDGGTATLPLCMRPGDAPDARIGEDGVG